MKTKLLENIQIVNTGRREHIKTPISDISYKIKSLNPIPVSYSYIYSVDVRLGANQVISQEALDASGDEALRHMKKVVGRAIAEEVYGEIRKELFELALELRASGNYYNNPASDRVEKMLEMIHYD